MNYGELKSQFEGLLKRRDSTAAQRATWLQMSISRAQRLLRIPSMEKVVSVTIDDTYDGELPIPDDYLRLKMITAGELELTQRDLTTVLDAVANSTGDTTIYARRGDVWILAPTPEEGDVFNIVYYAEMDELSDDDDENTLSVIAPDIILFGALSYAADYFIDKRKPAWEQSFMNAIAELQDQADQDELINGAASPSFVYPEDC